MEPLGLQRKEEPKGLAGCSAMGLQPMARREGRRVVVSLLDAACKEHKADSVRHNKQLPLATSRLLGLHAAWAASREEAAVAALQPLFRLLRATEEAAGAATSS